VDCDWFYYVYFFMVEDVVVLYVFLVKVGDYVRDRWDQVAERIGVVEFGFGFVCGVG